MNLLTEQNLKELTEIKWNDELVTGVERIDNQHREIIYRLNEFIKISTFEDEKEIDHMIRFLGGYLIDHFDTEEECMIKYNYPHYDRHKEKHMELLKNISILKRIFKEEGELSFMPIVMSMKDFCVDWLVDHINTEDKALSEFLSSKLC